MGLLDSTEEGNDGEGNVRIPEEWRGKVLDGGH